MNLLKKTKQPWERMPKENEWAFMAFNIYKDYGADRTVVKVAREIGRSEPQCYAMCRKWSWVERALAWDDEVQKKKNEATLKAAQDMAKRHANMAMAYQAPFLSMAKIAIEKIKTDEESIKEMDIDKFCNLFLNFSKGLDAITGVERKARGEATEITKTDITSNGKGVRVILPSFGDDSDEKDNARTDTSADDDGFDDGEYDDDDFDLDDEVI